MVSFLYKNEKSVIICYSSPHGTLIFCEIQKSFKVYYYYVLL